MSRTYISLHIQIYEWRNHSWSKILLCVSFFNRWCHYILAFLLETSYIPFPISGISVCKPQGPSVDCYWCIRGWKNSTCDQLYIPFNFAVILLSYCVLFKRYSCVTYLLAVPTSLLWEVDILNTFSSTSVKFTIVVLTWNYFTSYAKVLPI